MSVPSGSYTLAKFLNLPNLLTIRVGSRTSTKISTRVLVRGNPIQGKPSTSKSPNPAPIGTIINLSNQFLRMFDSLFIAIGISWILAGIVQYYILKNTLYRYIPTMTIGFMFLVIGLFSGTFISASVMAVLSVMLFVVFVNNLYAFITGCLYGEMDRHNLSLILITTILLILLIIRGIFGG